MNHMQPKRYRLMQNWMSNVSNHLGMNAVRNRQFNIPFHSIRKPLFHCKCTEMAVVIDDAVAIRAMNWLQPDNAHAVCYHILHNKLTKMVRIS